MTEWTALAERLEQPANICGCGKAYDPTPTGRLWHKTVHGHAPSPAKEG